jgi:signal transduction histidine kinase
MAPATPRRATSPWRPREAAWSGLSSNALARAPIFSDPCHLTSVLCAVIDNALLHGAMPVSVTLHEDRIVVADGGRGFSEDLIEHATERFVTGSPLKGVGLGLALAAAHGQLIGATLELRNLSNGGVEVSVCFPPHAAVPCCE